MIDAILRIFSSFRAQLAAFVAGMLVLTTLTLYYFNQRSEDLITQQLDEYIQATKLATEIAPRSLSEGLYLDDLVDPRKGGTLQVNSESIIRYIQVMDAGTKQIIDSTGPDEFGKKLAVQGELPAWKIGDLTSDNADKRDRTLTFKLDTEKGSRIIIIVISMERFYRVIDQAGNSRLLAIGLLGLLQVILISSFTRRITQPITGLSQAAQRVTAGDLDFHIVTGGPREISTLGKTFNEMVAELQRSRDLEDQLKHAERSALLGRLASGIAHEIRNPLNFINLSIDHLQASFPPKEEAHRASYNHILTTIKDELARLNRLVTDFLSYGRPAKLKLRELDARVLVEEVRDLVHTKAEEQGVKIGIEQSGPGETKIHADPEQIKTCFSNLMINAVQAMPGGGELNVRMRPVNAHLEIEFADTGSGILPENLTQIFEPYFSTKETGVGLGLPLTQKIIEEHGGQIAVTSLVGAGTTFLVTLPRDPNLPATVLEKSNSDG
jgi:signal transduction histidine kinase